MPPNQVTSGGPLSSVSLTNFRHSVYKRPRALKNRPASPRPMEERMFHAKMHDDDEELPRYEEEEEGLEQPPGGQVVEEIEETVIESEPGEEEAKTPAAPAP